jgi:hypothetical protein
MRIIYKPYTRLTGYYDPNDQTIVVWAQQSRMKQRIVIFHEIGHWLIDLLVRRDTCLDMLYDVLFDVLFRWNIKYVKWHINYYLAEWHINYHLNEGRG